MSVAEQSLAEFQAVLDRHRANESAYKDRLKEINLTRGKIADQLEALQQTYDKKLRGLEQKLESLRGQNDSLARENTLYRSEIETYQSRLLEKEKIIAALLAQRRDLPVVASSDKSKSEKTDSLNANEEESKAFKKQPLFK
jgi:chromosome segregation ATPase